MFRIEMPSPGILSAAPDTISGSPSAPRHGLRYITSEVRPTPRSRRRCRSATAPDHQPHRQGDQGPQKEDRHGDRSECPRLGGDDLRKKHDVAQYRTERRSEIPSRSALVEGAKWQDMFARNAVPP